MQPTVDQASNGGSAQDGCNPEQPELPERAAPALRAGTEHAAKVLRNGYLLAIMFFTAPAMTVKMAPLAPPPTSCPMTDPTSSPPPAAPAKAGGVARGQLELGERPAAARGGDPGGRAW